MADSSGQFKLRWPDGRGRVLVIGDIHGEYDMFQRLLKATEYSERDDFIFSLGDLVDRGPDSRKVLDWFAREHGRKSLLGNHEAMMADAALHWETGRIWYRNGGEWARNLDETAAYLYRCMIRQMPLSGEIEYDNGTRVGLVHAEVRPGLTWAQMSKVRVDTGDATNDWLPTDSASAIWGRSRYIADALLRDKAVSELSADRKVSAWRNVQPVKGIDLVICGHSVTADALPRGRGNVLWIDTGAGFHIKDFKGRLTAVDPLSRTYWQVGRTESDVWGPLPLPDPEPVPPALRPTRNDLKKAKEIEALAEEKKKAAFKLFGYG